jgi:hypothetical protein
MFHRAGVSVGIWLIYGYPIESDEDFEITAGWIEHNSGLLSDVCVNCFFPNEKYAHDRPGTVSDFSWDCTWQWQSQQTNLDIRNKRFFRIMDVLEQERQRHPHRFGYSVGDPFYTHYFQRWDDEITREAHERWKNAQLPLADPVLA